ncbi:fungal-specific transcription factor domain-containing protein, partial [Ilyonectria sp. MPI-CAGE-AT-0026]
SPMSHEVLGRLAEVERHLQLIRASVPYSVMQRNQRCPPTRTSVDGQPKSASVELLSALETDGQTFAGELSMTPALGEEDETSDCTNTASSGMLPEYPSPGSSLHHPTTRRVSGWLESILAQHGVVADEQQWRYDLQYFMDEVHPFYACLHSPKVWETFNDMWEYSTPWSLTDAAGRERKRLSLALVFFCLALGRCSVSLTTADASAVYSSGWSLYSVGMTLLQGGMETSSAATKSLPMLQALAVYLFRLDANQQAARVLALIVSMAHAIGIHRQSTMDGMPAFHNQLFCRTWWAIYMLDRRVAIESGKPYLIQDCNVDTALPIDLGDEWMTRFSTKTETIADLQHDIARELARDRPPSPIPYTVTMVRYSRMAGKAWDVLYGVRSPNTSMSAIVEYLDAALSKLLDTAPRDLRYPPEAPSEAHLRMSLRWQVKQSLILFTVSAIRVFRGQHIGMLRVITVLHISPASD